MIDVELLPRAVTLGSDGRDVTTLNVRYNVHVVLSNEEGSTPVGNGSMNLALLEDEELKDAAANLLGHIRRVLRIGVGLTRGDLRLVDLPTETEDEPL